MVLQIFAEIKEKEISFRGAADIIVDDAASVEYAGEIVLKGKSIIKEIDKKFEEPVKRAFAAHKAIKELQNEMKRPFEDCVNVLVDKIDTFRTEQYRKEKEAQAKLEAERKAAEDAEKAKLQAEATAARASGDAEKAYELELEAETVIHIPTVITPVIEKTVRTDAGTLGGQVDIEITITNEVAFLKAIAEKELLSLIKFENAKIKSYIKMLKIKDFPGLKIEDAIKTSFRNGKAS